MKSVRSLLLLGLFQVAFAQAAIIQAPFDESEYEALLAKMIGVTEQLQNHPEKGKIPKERLVANIIEQELGVLIAKEARPGNLTVKDIDYSQDKSRPNLIFTYHGTHPSKVVTFMGSHFDVVPADPSDPAWKGHNPFQLTKVRDEKGSRLIGRGVTDCLGHVAMLTVFLKRLAQERPKLDHSVVVVFIANEENGTIKNIGVDEVAKHGHLKGLEKGPVYWVDASDTMKLGPLTGTGGMQQFHFTFKGKACHSGLPSNGINSIQLQSEFICKLNKHFTSFFAPKNELETGHHRYLDNTSCKATQVLNGKEGSLNQVTGECKLGGDIRYTPLWDFPRLKIELEDFVAAFNKKIAESDVKTQSGRLALRSVDKVEAGRVELEWINQATAGYLADQNGAAYRNAVDAIKDLSSKDMPGFAVTGTLPLVAEMREQGFDLLAIGFGDEDAYHAPGEFGYTEDFANGFKFVDRIVERFEQGL